MLALGAQTENFGGVPGELKVVLIRHAVRPPLYGAAVDFHGGPAAGAHKVVVVLVGGALPVEGFPAGHVEHVHGINIRKRLQRAIDGGETDLVFAFCEGLVDFFRGRKVVEFAEDIDNSSALASAAYAELRHN